MPCINVFDIEATGLEPQYNVPFQFASGVYDSSTNLLSSLDLRGRLPRHVLPGAKALLVTDQSIGAIQSSPLSHYTFVAKIHEHMVLNSPAVVTSYNGLGYDDPVLRHTFYANLRQPYVTQLNKNVRMDVLLAAHATAACSPSALVLPLNEKGKRSFKLENVAPANGFAGHHAHDALGDVMATMHVAKTIRSNAPEVWNACIRMRSKEEMVSLLGSGEPIVQVEWNYAGDKATVRVVLPIIADNTNPSEWLCVNLSTDVDRLLLKDVSSLKDGFRSDKGHKPIVCIKANAMPLVFHLNDPAIANLDTTFDPASVMKIKGASDFRERLTAAADLKKSEYAEPDSVWDSLYAGGFFPLRSDAQVIARFHSSHPTLKYELIEDLRDPRAKELARWLIGSEWPEVMAFGDRSAFEDELRHHLMLDAAKWTTIPSGLEEIRKLRTGADAGQMNILDEYEAYLLNLANRWMLRAAE